MRWMIEGLTRKLLDGTAYTGAVIDAEKKATVGETYMLTKKRKGL